MSQEQPDPGKVCFFEKCPPALEAGDYTLTVDQKIYYKGCTENDAYSDEDAVDEGAGAEHKLPDTRSFDFKVTGPRFTLQPDEVHAAYPPPNSDGPFEARLPCVVLKRRTLPWERSAGSITIEGEDENLPWLALLLLEENEVTLLDPPKNKVRDILTHSPVIWGSNGSSWAPNNLAAELTKAELDNSCLGIELYHDKFMEIAPTARELRLLTHVRQVNTEDKELLGQDKDGWFAVVVGNRLPVSGRKYVACLVSLENQKDILPTTHAVLTEPRGADPAYRVCPEMAYRTQVLKQLRNPNGADTRVPENLSIILNTAAMAPAGWSGSVNPVDDISWEAVPGQYGFDVSTDAWEIPQPTVKLICLARWTFQCNGKGDFQGLMESLPESGGIGMLGMHPDQTTNSAAPARSKYRVAIDSGHIPLSHLTRGGELKTSFYRGPFTPVGVDRNLSEGPYHHADQARRVDPLTGLENLGYAAAFELGRLMALSDARFALELLKWRRSGHRRVNANRIAARLKDRLQNLIETQNLWKFIDERFLTRTLLERVGPGIVLEDLLGPLIDPTGLMDLRNILPGLDPAAVMEALNFTQDQVETLMGVDMNTGALQDGITGSAGLLDEIGYTADRAVDMGFDSMVENLGTELSHLETAHGGFINQFKGGEHF